MAGRPTKGRGAGARSDDRLSELLKPVVAESGLDLEAVSIGQVGRRKVVKVIVDGDDGVSLDDVAVLSRYISEALDGVDNGFGAGPYTLEVTSPGVDRPLTTARHWRRSIGRLVQYTLGGKVTQARIESVEGDRVTLERDGTRSTHSLDEVSPARVQVEFNKPSGSKE